MSISSKKNTSNFQLLFTLLVWLMIFVFPILFGESEDSIHWEHVFKVWKDNGTILALFLLNRFVLLPHFFFKGKKTIYLASITGLIAIFSLCIFISEEPNNEAFPANHQAPPPQLEFNHMPPPRHPVQSKESIPPYANFLIMGILIIGFDTGLVFYIKWLESEQNRVQSEKDSIENKMAFLKNQVSPHFFMNTLNNIHALVDISSEEAKEAIIKLSKMMAYMLYDSQSKKVALKEEIEFTYSYVELMKLRIYDEIDLILDLPQSVPNIVVPPLLTISFIENAFKHGVSYEHPSFVHIKYSITDTDILFNIKNSIHAKREDLAHSGIGLKNTINRLDLIYGSKYDLSINESKEKGYEVTLRIPI